MMFISPCEGRITTHYGKDVLNGQERDHFGIDLAKSGTVGIKAVADGVVSTSYRSTSYGECVRIIHQVNGKQWESLYAHMREGSRKVKKGQNIKQGDVIGLMGSTGFSTGQHLHFELHQPCWETDKRYSVDPLRYLPKKEDVHVAAIDKTKGIGYAKVKVEKLNLRKGPGTHHSVIRSLEQGEDFYVYEVKNGWYHLGGDQWASNQDDAFMDYTPHKIDDVTGHWAETSLKKALTSGVIKGYEDGSVKPNEPVTRGQLCAILDRMGLFDV